jgi:N-carbamoylputrescine amidase
MRITVCEMPDDRAQFERQWERLGAHIRNQSSDLVLLPEMPFYNWFASAPKFDFRKWEEAVGAHRSWKRRLSELGAKAVIGSAPVYSQGRRLNEGFVWTKKGGVRGVHLKNYLPNEPGFYEASWYSRGGKGFTPFEVSGWKVGPMLCSDLWSMSSAREYGKQGVQLVAVPRATPEGSIDKWIAGGKVAAVLAGAYCASSNRGGAQGDLLFAGKGWVISPDAEVLGLTSKAKPFVTVTIDRAKAQHAKTTYPRSSLEPD